jgi:SAM-dependent methyltransferase
MSDIYNDNTYLEYNPTIHIEDSEFKFNNIIKFLEKIKIQDKKIKILDIGGGAGIIGKMVMEFFLVRGINVIFDCLDLSAEMLKIQKENNPKINKLLNCSLEDCREKDYDLILMIDVIEHIPKKNLAAKILNKMTKNIIYNIPIEINLFDLIRNISLLFRYYKNQTKVLGHVHFFSFLSVTSFLKKHHEVIEKKFIPYCFYIKDSQHQQYIDLRKSILRRIEIKISCWINKKIKNFSSYLIQGSCYTLVETKNTGKV